MGVVADGAVAAGSWVAVEGAEGEELSQHALSTTSNAGMSRERIRQA
jgi:hypothetical protein